MESIRDEASEQAQQPVPFEAQLSRRQLLFGLGGVGALAVVGGVGFEYLRSQESRFASEADWEHDFSTMPDGQPTRDDWNFTEGTEVPGYNQEAQAYVDWQDTVRIENGLLVIEARKIEHLGQDYVSSRIDTDGIFDFTYGKVEVEMRLPSGAGTWPAAWLMPSRNLIDPTQYGLQPEQKWPLNGEIDIIEAIGAQPDKIFGNAHTFNSLPQDGRSTDTEIHHTDVPTLDTNFHTYAVEWLPDSLTFTVDGNEYYKLQKTSDDPRDWPFDQPYHLILNLAMGGTWGGEARDSFPPHGVDDASGPWQMQVKAVRHFPLAEQ